MSAAIIRLHKSNRLSVPTSKRSLFATTKPSAEHLLTAHQCLCSFLRNVRGDVRAWYENNYFFLKYNDEKPLPKDVLINLLSSALTLNWIIGRIINAIPEKASLNDAAEWFNGKTLPQKSIKIPEQINQSVVESLSKLSFDENLIELLPYIVEVFETSNEILTSSAGSRKKKKLKGIFYTPSDVSDYLVETILSRHHKKSLSMRNYTWLDPACGTGCILLSVLYLNAKEKGLITGENSLQYVKKCLYGIDSSPIALQSAVYILTYVSMKENLLDPGAMRRSLFSLGLNFLVKDATKIRNIKQLSESFQSLDSGADFVVSNPPYLKRQDTKQVSFEESYNGKMEQHAVPRFIQMMTDLSHFEHGKGGMIAPLSVSYNSQQAYKKLRQLMWTKDEWYLAHFDRTPDSLFGDDVKTRNTIVFFSRNNKKNELYSTDLIRWNSRLRKYLFENIKFARVSEIFRDYPVPKCGDELGQNILNLLIGRQGKLLSYDIERINKLLTSNNCLLRNTNTAYNWLPFEITSAQEFRFDGTKSRFRYWRVKNENQEKDIFAIIQSRLTYWLWRIWGDGFHLTDNFIKNLPLSPNNFGKNGQRKLAELGGLLWKDMLENKVLNSNAGIITVTYCPYVSEDILDDIDRVIIDEYGLPEDTATYLKAFVKRTIVAGRDEEIYANPALRKWRKMEEKRGYYIT